MTVRELIEALQEFPMDHTVMLYEYDERGGDYYPLTELREGHYSEQSGSFNYVNGLLALKGEPNAIRLA